MESVFYIGIAMVAGLVFNRLAKLVHLPNVTGYLVAGVLIGPFALNLINADSIAEMTTITNVALGFIAFSIGGSFKIENIKLIGGKVLIITALEACVASLFVFLIMLALKRPMEETLCLAAIAAATAPAATLMVIKQYKASGPVTNMLLPVVAMDDAVCLILFSVLSSVAAVIGNGTQLSVSAMILDPLKEICLALLLGAALGFAVAGCDRLFKSRANRTSVVVCAVFLGTALAEKFSLSSLLVCMMISAITVNFTKDYEKMLEVCDRWTPPIFMLFFVISGAGLDFSVLARREVLITGIAYVLFRAAGKYLGATAGSAITKAEKNIVKYLGFALLPQAGVAIGLSGLVGSIIPQYGAEIRTIILCGTLIYELTGSIISKLALQRAGEIPKATAK